MFYSRIINIIKYVFNKLFKGQLKFEFFDVNYETDSHISSASALDIQLIKVIIS